MREDLERLRRDAADFVRRSGEVAALHNLETYVKLHATMPNDPLGVMAAFAALGLATAMEAYYAEEADRKRAQNN